MLLAASAHGQEGKPRTDEIIVTGRSYMVGAADTATKTEGAVLTTPQAVSLVDPVFIDALKLRSVAEALNYTSGVRSQSYGSDTHIDFYQLRGFANQSFFKDGLILYNSGAFLSWATPAEGVERLEALKGPSSALYGGGSAGGFVNIVSKGPTRRPLTRLEAGVDEYGSGYGSFDLSGPASATLAFRAVGLVRRGDTQVSLAQENRSFGALALSWAMLPDTTLTLRGSYTRDRSNRPTGFVPYAGFVTPLPDGRRIPIDLFVSDPSVDRYDRDQIEGGYALESRIKPQLRFMSKGRYGRIDLIYAGLYGQFSGNPVLAGGRAYLARADSRQDAWLGNVAIDNHLDLTLRTGPVKHDLLVGIDYSAYRTSSTVAMGAAPRLDIFAPRYGVPIPALNAASTARQSLDQVGLYMQERFTLGGLTALLSARHDQVDVTTASSAGAVSHGAPARVSYRAGVSYLTAVGLAPYVSHATSFTPVVGVEAATGAFYRPEIGRAWEAGLKFQPRGLPLLATASLFSIDRDGVLVANPVPGFPTNQSQLGAVQSRGGEAEVQTHAMRGLDLTASVTAFRIRNRSGTPASLGRAPTATPQFTAAVFGDYRFPAGSLLSGIGFGAGIRHVGRSYADVINTLPVPAATVADAAIHYDFNRFRVATNVSNLFDRRYVAACTSAGTCYAANLRRATFSVAYRLGDPS